MSEDIKGLIEKIQQEGIIAAENKARQIEEEARRKAGDIIARAKVDSERVAREAKESALKTEENTATNLGQAARDLLLILRKQINDTLDKLITAAARQALSDQELTRAISSVIHNIHPDKKGDVVITLNSSEKDNLEGAFLARLKDELKKGIVLKGSDEISAGFVISFDGGKSQFDFTDSALAKYLGGYLKPSLEKVFRDISG